MAPFIPFPLNHKCSCSKFPSAESYVAHSTQNYPTADNEFCAGGCVTPKRCVLGQSVINYTKPIIPNMAFHFQHSSLLNFELAIFQILLYSEAEF